MLCVYPYGVLRFPAMSTHATNRIVGTSVPRKEGNDKLLGAARYVDDIEREGMWYGATVRSSIPRGLIRSIGFDRHIDWNEFTVVTAADIPGQNCIQMIAADQPCLADGNVNHCDEAILLLAHPDKHKVRAAVNAVHIEYDLLPPIFTIEESEKKQIVVWGSDNLFKSFELEKGNVDSAWTNAAHIVNGEYRTGAQEHLYIENNGVIAEYSAENGVTVWGSLQCPFYVHRSLLTVFDLPGDKVRVVQTETGGAFGGKEDYPSTLASHAALLAMKSEHPVKMVYDRMEDLAATTKRHPSRVRHRTALDANGKLLAMDIEIATDGGAYSTLSSTVLSRATLHSPGPYFCPNVRIRSRSWATNTVPYGAFRGFGAPQTVFAVERHMDEIAAFIGMEPVELRRRNFLRDGDTTATEQVMREPVILDKLLDRALAESDYNAKRARFARENPTKPVKRGMGIASFYHGSGFTGSGERYLNSLAGIDVTPEGKVRVLVSNTEFGQGTNTILTQIAAEAIGIDYADVAMAAPDTGIVPNSGPTVASRTVDGGRPARSNAPALQLLAMLREHAGLGEHFHARRILRRLRTLSRSYTAKSSRCAATKRRPASSGTTRNITAKPTPPMRGPFTWRRSRWTPSPTPPKWKSSGPCRKWAAFSIRCWPPGRSRAASRRASATRSTKKSVWQNGHMANNQMTNYIMPTAEDVPPIHVYFEEIPFQYGGYGAKGIGELPHDGPAPAILNAIRDATGVSFHSIPLLPEDLFAGLTARQQVEEPAAAMSAIWPTIRFIVNGEHRTVQAPPMKRLLDVLREDLHLTGTKEGCGEGECGSCSVRMNGELVNSCLVPVLQAEGAEHPNSRGTCATMAYLHPLQAGFPHCGGAQCGICTPGMLMAAAQLLAHNPNPCMAEIREGLAGNLCRCTGFIRIFESVLSAATAAPSEMLQNGQAMRGNAEAHELIAPGSLSAVLESARVSARRVDTHCRRNGVDGGVRCRPAQCEQTRQPLGHSRTPLHRNDPE